MGREIIEKTSVEETQARAGVANISERSETEMIRTCGEKDRGCFV